MKSANPSDSSSPDVSTANRGQPLVVRGAAARNGTPRGRPRLATGNEGQRCADQGDGTYVNRIVAGDHADPTILKDGEDYYLTFSSFLSYPGIVIWHSTIW